MSTRFKRLNIPAGLFSRCGDSYPTESLMLAENGLIRVGPVFGRDGYYFDRKERRVWCEHAGRAYAPDPARPHSNLSLNDFFYPLRLLSQLERPFRTPELGAVVLLLSTNFFPKRMKNELRERIRDQVHYLGISGSPRERRWARNSPG